MGDMKEYKAWRDMSPSEKKKRRWDEAGQPRLVWNSSKQGTYRKGPVSPTAK